LARLADTTAPPPRSISVDPHGRFLYLATTGSVQAYRIDPTSGSLDPAGQFPLPFPGSHFAGPMVASARSLFMIMRSGTTGVPNRTWSYAIDERTGALVPVGEFTAAIDPAVLELDRAGQFLYVGAYRGTAPRTPILQTLRLSRSGAVIEAGSMAVGAGFPYDPYYGFLGAHSEIDPTGRFLWLTINDFGEPRAILAYRIDGADGLPVPIAFEPLYGQLVAHPTGRFLYAATDREIVTHVVRRNTTGALARVAALPTSVGGALAVDPGDSFLYASGSSGGTVLAFAINGDDGSLQQVGAVAPGGPVLALVRLP
jgi:6-phosphogluconolactonase (cycloisomerase 2 family)